MQNFFGSCQLPNFLFFKQAFESLEIQGRAKIQRFRLFSKKNVEFITQHCHFQPFAERRPSGLQGVATAKTSLFEILRYAQYDKEFSILQNKIQQKAQKQVKFQTQGVKIQGLNLNLLFLWIATLRLRLARNDEWAKIQHFTR